MSRTIERDPRLARRGMALFMRVSRRASADTFGQAALIAEYCLQRELHPSDMGRLLLADEPSLTEIRDQGNREHRLRGAKAEVLVLDSVRAQVTIDFEIAGSLMRNERARTHYLSRVRPPVTRAR